MNAERLDIARRLVACKGWVWLPGMRVPWGGEHGRVIDVGPTGDYVYLGFNDGGDSTWFTPSLTMMIPDLDDDLTRMGVLAVVRRVFPGDGPHGPWLAPSYDTGKPEWFLFVGGVVVGSGPTEEAALLAALETAP